MRQEQEFVSSVASKNFKVTIASGDRDGSICYNNTGDGKTINNLEHHCSSKHCCFVK